MRPHNVRTTLFWSQPNTSKTTFLFQAAMYWARQGSKVLYISPLPFDKIPSSIHGVPAPDPAVLSFIRFMYFPQWQDLLKQLYALHTHASIPEVIVLEGLEHYCQLYEDTDENSKKVLEKQCTLVCASVLDAMSVCASFHKTEVTLVASLEHCNLQSPVIYALINLFFNDVVWLVEAIEFYNEIPSKIRVTDMTANKLCRSKIMFELSPREFDGELVLEKISERYKSK